MSRLVRFLGLLALAAACLPVASAAALSYPVTSTADSGAKGTLRGSIEEANAHTGVDSIPIEVTGTIDLLAALPQVIDHVTIVGPGAEMLTIRRASLEPFGILDFGPGVTASLSEVTISNGLAERGAGIANASGSLTLTRVLVSGNEAFDSGGVGASARGGGVYSVGPLTLRESTVRGNVATAEEQGFSVVAQGGGVYAEGALTVDLSTISENEVRAFEGLEEIIARGGGLRAVGEPVKIEQSTFSGNSAVAESSSAFGANLDLPSAGLVRNTIVADPDGDADSCAGEPTSGGFNLDEDGSCGFGQPTDLVGVIAGLEPLADNGGPTPTHALRAGSPALDRGNSFGSGVDQRGLPRPSDFATISNAEGGDGSDIGAFEVQVPPSGPAAVQVKAVAGDRQPPNTRIVIGPARVTFKREAKFRFASTEGQSSFQCKLDKKKWRGCRNPFKRTVKPGKHLFKVRAIDRFGNVDPTPARFGWRVKPIGG